MASAVGIVLVKQFTYRGNNAEEWSNKYWLTGQVPQDDNAWLALVNKLIDQELTCYTSASRVTSAYTYNDNTEGAHSVWSRDFLALGEDRPGTLVNSPANYFAGDQAGVLEFKTARKNTRGKWIYLRKYFHGGLALATNPEELDTATATAYAAFGQKLQVATPLLENRIIRSQKMDEFIQGHSVIPWVTTRTLKRRGKRP